MGHYNKSNFILTFRAGFIGRLKSLWASGIQIKLIFGLLVAFYVNFSLVTLFFQAKTNSNRSKCLWKRWARLPWNLLTEAQGLLSFSISTHRNRFQTVKESFELLLRNHWIKNSRDVKTKNSWLLSKNVFDGFQKIDSNLTRPFWMNGFWKVYHKIYASNISKLSSPNEFRLQFNDF